MFAEYSYDGALHIHDSSMLPGYNKFPFKISRDTISLCKYHTS